MHCEVVHKMLFYAYSKKPRFYDRGVKSNGATVHTSVANMIFISLHTLVEK